MAGETNTDPRLDDVQERVDEIRDRLPKEPGMTVPDPDVKPLFPETDEDVYPDDEA